jgi:uncharacterized protein YdhG (YjbR/CyaY superfamily)
MTTRPGTTPPAAASVGDYVAALPPATQQAFETLRAAVRAAAPEATERVSYGILGFALRGRILVYLAGWKEHVALYPVTPAVVAALGEAIAPYRSGKGTLRFPLAHPVPEPLVRRIVACRVEELSAARPRGARARPPQKQ